MTITLNREKDKTEPCNCAVCVRACTYVPGWFLPGEAEVAAKHLNLTLQEFFNKYLTVNWYEGNDNMDTVFVLSPAITRASAGTEAPSDPRGVCVFFQPETLTCKIFPHHPYECITYYHIHDLKTLHERHIAVADAWKDHQDLIKELLGREPQERIFEPVFQPQSLGDLFNRMF